MFYVIEECTETINKLSDFGIGAILDYSVEGKENESDNKSIF